MDFAFTDEQTELRNTARSWLADRYPPERVVALADSAAGWDPASLPAMAALGWLGLSVAETDGGAGMGFVEEAVLFEETGRALLPGPLFSTVGLALPALAAVGGDAVAGVVAGSRSATLAWAGPDGAGELTDTSALPVSSAGSALSGTARYVADLTLVDDAVVVAAGRDGPALWLVDLRTSPDVVRPRSTTDRTRRLGDLVLDATPATLLVGPVGTPAVLASTRLRALAALSLEAVGVAQWCLATCASYAGQREQFGRVIGTYQGVSHRVADIYVALELARSLAYWAAWTVSVDDASAPVACAAAKSAAGAAAVQAAQSAIQVMGGIGFTWDHPLHRWYKRAQGIESFEGGGRTHRETVARALLDDVLAPARR